MCRSGKDNTFRICPGQKNPENVKHRNIQKKSVYMHQKVADRLAAFEEKVSKLNAEALAQGNDPLDEKTLEEMKKKEVYLPSTDLTYRNHTKYAHVAVAQMKDCGFNTDINHNDNILKDEHGPVKDLEGRFTEVSHAGKTSRGDIVWSEERKILHQEIMRELLKKWEHLPRERKAIFSGGLGGAGKGTVLKSESLNIDEKEWATLNPDDIKEILAEKKAIPAIEGLTPMEASPLVHEEASHITKMLTSLLLERGTNIIYDTTMGSLESTRSKISNMKISGYDVEAVFVDISMKTSDIRADKRHLSGHNRYLLGIGNGGRLLPRDVTAHQTPNDPQYRSLNAENFLALHREGLFSNVQAFDNDGSKPVPLQLDELRRPVVAESPKNKTRRKQSV